MQKSNDESRGRKLDQFRTIGIYAKENNGTCFIPGKFCQFVDNIRYCFLNNATRIPFVLNF